MPEIREWREGEKGEVKVRRGKVEMFSGRKDSAVD